MTQPLLAADKLNPPHVSVHGIGVDSDGVLYEQECTSTTRRRRVAPESTKGTTRHVVVASQTIDDALDDSMFTDFELVSDRKLVKGFRYWRDKKSGKLQMSTQKSGDSMAKYMQVVTMNSWSQDLALAISGIVMISISKYSTATFITTVSYVKRHYQDTMSYVLAVALPVVFFLHLTYQLFAAYSAAQRIWKRHTQQTGDLLLRDCNELPAGSLASQEGSVLSFVERWYTFLSMWLLEFFMVPRTIKEAPTAFHGWKGSGAFANVKAEGARIQFVGHMTKSAFLAGESTLVAESRLLIGILADFVLAYLKWHNAIKQSNWFIFVTIGVPLAYTLYNAQQLKVLWQARAHFRKTILDRIQNSDTVDPYYETAVRLQQLLFPKEASRCHDAKPDLVRSWSQRSSGSGTTPSPPPSAVGGQKFALRLKARVDNLNTDLRLLEAKLGSNGNLANLVEPLLRKLEDLSTEPRDDEKVEEAVERIKKGVLGDKLCICILGGTAFNNEDSKELVESLANDLATGPLYGKVAFVTGGMEGVQKVFAENCGDGSQVWNLIPRGTPKSACNKGQDIRAGKDLKERIEVFGQLGDIYVTVEGGPGVAKEAIAASKRGAPVVPLIRSGGASCGMFDFPAEALEPSARVDPLQWALLSRTDIPPFESAKAAAHLLAILVAPPIESVASVVSRAPKITMRDSSTLTSFVAGGASYTQAVTEPEITNAISLPSVIPRESWQGDTSNCAICRKALGKQYFRRRHHCRLCGKCVCSSCSQATVEVDGVPERACTECAAVASQSAAGSP